MRRPLVLVIALAALALPAAGCGGEEPAGAAETEIAFVSSRDSDYAVFGMRADGSGQGRLTSEHPEETMRPSDAFFQVEPGWSPDGEKLVFTSRREGPSHIYVMNADGTGTKQLTSGKHEDQTPAWSPDGTRIVFVRDGRLFVMTSTGASPHRLTDTLGGEDGEPAWSPDGERIAYVRRLPGFTTRDVWVVNADGKGAERLTGLVAATYGPAWSPDGRRIVFTSNAQDDRYQVYEVGADGEGLKRLTFKTGEYFDPSWSPDGKTLVVERDGIIYALAKDGAEEALTDGPNDGSPAWRPVVPAPGS